MRGAERKQSGFIVSVELLFILVFVVMGVVIGWSTLKDSVVNELQDTAAAIDALNQSYAYAGMTSHSGTVQGSTFSDAADYCETATNTFDEQFLYGHCISQIPALNGG